MTNRAQRRQPRFFHFSIFHFFVYRVEGGVEFILPRTGPGGVVKILRQADGTKIAFQLALPPALLNVQWFRLAAVLRALYCPRPAIISGSSLIASQGRIDSSGEISCRCQKAVQPYIPGMKFPGRPLPGLSLNYAGIPETY